MASLIQSWTKQEFHSTVVFLQVVPEHEDCPGALCYSPLEMDHSFFGLRVPILVTFQHRPHGQCAGVGSLENWFLPLDRGSSESTLQLVVGMHTNPAIYDQGWVWFGCWSVLNIYCIVMFSKKKVGSPVAKQPNKKSVWFGKSNILKRYDKTHPCLRCQTIDSTSLKKNHGRW